MTSTPKPTKFRKSKKAANTAGQVSSIHYSNAGHDYHKLWVIRRLVTMLSPKSPLTCVKVEGVNINDSVNIGRANTFLAADMTEYFGGTDFEKSTTIVISQLKYSTTNSDGKWTLPALMKRSSKKATDSVIQRLADSYKNLIENGFDRDKVVNKTSIRLVSNQSLDEELAKSIALIRRIIDTVGKTLSYSQFLSHIPRSETVAKKQLKALYERLNIADGDFFNFLTILDLSGCNSGSRSWQQLTILDELSESVSASERHSAYLSLKDLVNSHTLPEKANSEGIKREDVLAALGVTTYKQLFPAQPELSLPNDLIKSSEPSVLANALTTNARILAHGVAGAGKSTTLQRLKHELPSGSVMILYDCFGGGNYQNISSGRHTLLHAVIQISNELSAQTGLPFLTTPPANDKYALFDLLQDRINKAARLIAQNDGLLIVAIDAADNAVSRASSDVENSSFVSYLWELKLPTNCRLIMSARSGDRANSLSAPKDIYQFKLSGFDLDASSLHFRQVFSEASEESCLAFHERTRHNPRIQQYLLDQAKEHGSGFSAFLNVFRRAHLVPEEIFENIIEQAIHSSNDKVVAQSHLAVMTCLQRPIPLSIFANACHLTLEQARHFCEALHPGILFNNDRIEIRDEDFDTHLRVRPETEAILKQTHTALAHHFKTIASSNTYAAQVVVEHFWRAELHAELIDFVLEEPSLDIIPDSLTRIAIREQRIQQALKAAAHLGQDKKGVQLLLLACELKNTNEATRSLVQANVSLANRFGQTDGLINYFDLTNNGRWMGAVHFSLAAAYAKEESQRILAEEHLRQGEAWVGRFMRSLNKQNYEWEIRYEDLANGAEAVFWLHGVSDAKQWLSRWTPLESVFYALNLLVHQLIPWLNDDAIEQHLVEANLSVRAECIVLAELWKKGRTIKTDRVLKLSKKLLPAIKEKHIQRRRPRKYVRQSQGLGWTIPIAELFSVNGVDKDTILLVLDELGPTIPDHAPYDNLDDFILPLHASALRAALLTQGLTINDLLPPKLHAPPRKPDQSYQHDPNEEDRRKFKGAIEPLLPTYTLFAQVLTRQVEDSVVAAQIHQDIEELHTFRAGTENITINRRVELLLIAGKTLANVEGQTDLLDKLLKEANRTVGQYRARKFWLKLGQYLLPYDEYKQLGLKWIEEAANDIESDSVNIDDRWRLLLNAAEVAFQFDDELSQDLYRRAVKAANEGVSDEVVFRLGVSARQLKRLADSSNFTNKSTFGMRQAALTEAYKPFVSGDVEVPLELTLEVAAQLDLASGIKLFSRWDVKNLLPIEQGIGPLLKGAVESNHWPAWISVPLLRIQGETADKSHLGLEFLNPLNVSNPNQQQLNPAKAEVFDSLAFWARRDAFLRHRTESISRLSEWGNKNGLAKSEAVSQLDSTLDFVNTLFPKQLKTEKKLDEDFIVWYSKAKKGDLTAYQAEKSIHYGMNIPDLRNCLLTLGDNVLYSQRSAFLEFVCQISFYQEHHYQIEFGHLLIHILATFLEKWKKVQSVQEWMNHGDNIRRFLAKNIGTIINEGQWPCHLESFFALPHPEHSSRAAVILPTIADLLPRLDVDRICRVAESLSETISIHDRENLISWLLDRLENQLQRDSKELPFNVLKFSSPSNHPPEVEGLAQLCWYLLGYPDTRVRWQTVHAVREIISWNANGAIRSALLTRLLELSASTVSDLATPGYDFFWMSARVWLMLLFERIADELPVLVLPHAQAIAAHGLNNNLPHVQIRGLAQKTLLRLRQHQEGLFTQDQWHQLEQINKPIACLLNRDRYEAYGDPLFLTVTRAERIKFDRYDVKEHWFDRLGTVFAHPSETVAILAERWIYDQWEYNQESYGRYWEYQSRYDYGLKYYSKLSEPVVDSLQSNLNYNALMCVAGEMVGQVSVLMEKHSDNPCESLWEGWIEDQLTNSSPHGWLSDLRTPIPLLSECWGQLPEPWHKRAADDFIEALGTQEQKRQGWLVIYGNRDFGYSSRHEDSKNRYGDTNVRSVLVDLEMASSLVRALQAADPGRYVFPSFGLDEDDMDWIGNRNNDFVLHPLIVDEKSISEGLESKDSSKRGVRGVGVRIASTLVQDLSLKVKNKGMLYVDQHLNEAICLEQWSDDTREERYHPENTYSSGFRIWIKWSALRAYMQKNKQVLIIQVKLQRNYSKQERENQYDHGKHVIYTLHPNGRLEFMDQHYTLWPENNS